VQTSGRTGPRRHEGHEGRTKTFKVKDFAPFQSARSTGDRIQRIAGLEMKLNAAVASLANAGGTSARGTNETLYFRNVPRSKALVLFATSWLQAFEQAGFARISIERV
jgi:hypothetical protein